MALNYRALTNEDEKRLSVLAAGQYPFSVDEIKLDKSKGGIDKDGKPKPVYQMLVASLKILNENGQERTLRDWILLVDAEDRMGFKFRHFSHTCGLIDKYEAHTITLTDFRGKHGVCKIGVREYIDEFGEKKLQNSVIDYIKAANHPQKSSNDFLDDEIPSFS